MITLKLSLHLITNYLLCTMLNIHQIEKHFKQRLQNATLYDVYHVFT